MAGVNVASLFGEIKLKDEMTSGLNKAKRGLTSFEDSLKSTGQKVKSFGQDLSLIMAPFALAMGASVVAARDFDEDVTNVGAVLGLTRTEIVDLKSKLLDIGSTTRAGPQAVAEAFYDIVGGVADASTHMAILKAAIATSEAGNSDLVATANALISVMNSYSLTATDAAMVSDVLTRTVAVGVGTMDDFAAALPNVTGLANSLGISFSDVGMMMAFLTTKGNSASEAATQLSGMMTAMLNPNEKMKTALHELGFATGQAAIEQLGLLGAYEALGSTQTAQSEGMAELVGRAEALRGVTSFAGDEIRTFMGNFRDGLLGATDAARDIQMESAAAQFDLLKSSVSGLAITVGDALLPILLDIADTLKPLIADVVDWIGKNPELTKTILMIAGGLVVLGPLLMMAGQAVTLVGGGVGLLKTGLWALMTPIGAVSAAVLALIGVFIQLKSISDQYWAVEKERQAFYARGGTAQQAQQITSGSVANQIRASQQQGLGGQAAAIGFINALGGFGPTGQLGGGLQAQTGQVSGIIGQLMQGVANYTGHDFPGMGTAGAGYGVGVPEMWEGKGGSKIMFMPRENGQFTPMGAGGGGLTVTIGAIYANDAAGGAAAAESFEKRLSQLYKGRGN